MADSREDNIHQLINDRALALNSNSIRQHVDLTQTHCNPLPVVSNVEPACCDRKGNVGSR
jgi:hypothetical protein